MLPEKQEKACRAFYDTVRDNGILDSKTTILIHLAASLAFACYPCMETYLNMAREEGISDEEIGATEGIVSAVSAGRSLRNLETQEMKQANSLSSLNAYQISSGDSQGRGDLGILFQIQL